MRGVLCPEIFAIFTWSRFLNDVVWARTALAVHGQLVIPMMSAVTKELRELMLTETKIKIIKEGITIKILVIVERILSHKPPI